MDLIHAPGKGDVVDALREAAAHGRRILIVGGRRHADRGNPVEVDAELWTTQLNALVSYEPAEMVVVAAAGMRVGGLDRILAEGGQEWAVDAPPEATVGGVIASGVAAPRQLRVGAVRDSVLEVEMVTGDGRLVKGGARTVKNVTGYDLPRLAAGSLGTLGAIVQVALKVRPRPEMRRTERFRGDGMALARALLDAAPLAAGVLATAGAAEIRLEGWAEEVERQAAAAREVADAAGAEGEAGGAEDEAAADGPFPGLRPWETHPVVAEAAVPPSRLGALAEAAGEDWGGLAGVGIMWAGLPSDGDPLDFLRAKAADLGGVAPVVRGPGGLGPTPLPAAAVHRRLKRAFDPAGTLAPGRFWGGI